MAKKAIKMHYEKGQWQSYVTNPLVSQFTAIRKRSIKILLAGRTGRYRESNQLPTEF